MGKAQVMQGKLLAPSGASLGSDWSEILVMGQGIQTWGWPCPAVHCWSQLFQLVTEL